MNTYGYVGGNPLRYIDPYGLYQLPSFGFAPSFPSRAPTLTEAANYGAGFGDNITMNITRGIRQASGLGTGSVDEETGPYLLGNATGVVVSAYNVTNSAVTIGNRLNNARKWRANSKHSRKTRNKKIQEAGNYSGPAAEGALALFGGSLINSLYGVFQGPCDD